jgi:hypothetical protein
VKKLGPGLKSEAISPAGAAAHNEHQPVLVRDLTCVPAQCQVTYR